MSIIRRDGSDLIVETTLINSSGTGITSGVTVSASIQRQSDDLWWDSTSMDFDDVSEPSQDSLSHTQDGLWEFKLVGGAESVSRGMRVHLTVTGNPDVNIDAFLSDFVEGTTTALTSQQIRDAMKLAPTGGAPSAGSVDEHLDDILGDTNEMQGKLPTNNIMGSSVKTDKDDEIDAIKATTDNLPNSGALTDIDTGVNNIEAKLPTNFIMGSSDATDKDDEIDAIKAVTDNLPNSGALTDIDTGVNNIEAKLPTNFIMGSSDQSDKDDEIDAIKLETDKLTLVDAGAGVAGSIIEEIENRATPAQVGSEITSAEPIDANVVQVSGVAEDLPTETNATSNTSSINTNIDANETKIDSLQTSVDGVSLVTRLSTSVSKHYVLPLSGDEHHYIEVTLKNTSGQMEDPDGVSIDTGTADGQNDFHLIDSGADWVTTTPVKIGDRVIQDPGGTETYATVTAVSATDLTLDKNIFPVGTETYEIERPEMCLRLIGSNSGTITSRTKKSDGGADLDASTLVADTDVQLERTGTGRYFMWFKINDADAKESLSFRYGWQENGDDLIELRPSHLFDESPGSSTLADNITNKDVVAKAIREYDSSSISLGTNSIEKRLDDDLTNIEADTQDIQTQIGTAGAGLTDLGGMSTGMKAEVEAEATDALNAYDPPTRTEATSDKDEIITEVNANETKIDAVQTTADNIETDTQDIQTQIGTAGAGLTDLGGMSTGMKAEVEAEATDALNAYDPPTRTEATADKDAIITEVDANETKIDALDAKVGTVPDLGSGATLGDNNTDMAGSSFDTSTDSQEAIRDRGDAAWTTAAGGSSLEKYPEGLISYTSSGGAAGTTLGTNGTSDNQVDNEDDALTLAAALGTDRIAIYGGWSMGNVTAGTITDRHFEAQKRSMADIGDTATVTSSNSKDIDGCSFKNIYHSGSTAYNDISDIRFDSCELVSLKTDTQDGRTEIYNSNVFGTLKVASLVMDSCKSSPGSAITVDCTLSGSGDNYKITRHVGDVTLTNETNGLDHHIHLMGGHLTIDASCTTGSLTVTGWGNITDNSTGTFTVTSTEFQVMPVSSDANITQWDGNAVTGDGDWAQLQTDVSSIDTKIGAPYLLTDGVTTASLVDMLSEMAEKSAAGGAYDRSLYSLEALYEAINSVQGSTLLTTTINGVPASNKEFVLTDGSASDDTYKGAIAVIEASPTSKGFGVVQDWNAGTKTLTLYRNPIGFVPADTNKVTILASFELKNSQVNNGVVHGKVVTATLNSVTITKVSSIIEEGNIYTNDDILVNKVLYFIKGGLVSAPAKITAQAVQTGTGKTATVVLTTTDIPHFTAVGSSAEVIIT